MNVLVLISTMGPWPGSIALVVAHGGILASIWLARADGFWSQSLASLNQTNASSGDSRCLPRIAALRSLYSWPV